MREKRRKLEQKALGDTEGEIRGRVGWVKKQCDFRENQGGMEGMKEQLKAQMRSRQRQGLW